MTRSGQRSWAEEVAQALEDTPRITNQDADHPELINTVLISDKLAKEIAAALRAMADINR